MFIKSGNDELLLKYWEMLGNGSKYSSQIFDYVVDLGVRPQLKYVNLAKNDDYGLVFDDPERSFNLLARMVKKSPSFTQRSVADAMKLISHLPYQNPSSNPDNHFSVVGRLNPNLTMCLEVILNFIFYKINQKQIKHGCCLTGWMNLKMLNRLMNSQH